MRYFNGFGFCNEAELFKVWIPRTDTTVAGFSYGAQQAMEYALRSPHRIDRLALLSPAFFQDKNDAFVRLQLKHFKRDAASYADAFYANACYPADIDIAPYRCDMSAEDLEKLLSYQWSKERFSLLAERGTTVEVIIGEQDRIINAEAAFDFFQACTTTYLLRGSGHLLI